MSFRTAELARLVLDKDARVLIELTRDECRIMWNGDQFYEADPTRKDAVLYMVDSLLVRLGYRKVSPFVKKLTFTQRCRLDDLIMQMRALRREVEGPREHIADVEPRLASPRSSLDPRLTDGERASDDGIEPVGSPREHAKKGWAKKRGR